MTKTKLALVSAVSTLVALPAVAADPSPVLKANSYAELLAPIPDAKAQLQQAVLHDQQAQLIPAQYYYSRRYVVRRRYRRYYSPYYYPYQYYQPYYYHHHHHHPHHHHHHHHGYF
jgi:hypothetical protein